MVKGNTRNSAKLHKTSFETEMDQNKGLKAAKRKAGMATIGKECQQMLTEQKLAKRSKTHVETKVVEGRRYFVKTPEKKGNTQQENSNSNRSTSNVRSRSTTRSASAKGGIPLTPSKQCKVTEVIDPQSMKDTEPNGSKGTEVTLPGDGMTLCVNADEEREFQSAEDETMCGQSDEESDLEPDSEVESDKEDEDDEVILQHNLSQRSNDATDNRSGHDDGSDDEESEREAMKLLSKNPKLGNYFQKIIKKGIADEMRTLNGKQESICASEKAVEKTLSTPKLNNAKRTALTTIRSPSDTTIYAPALK